MTQAASAIDIPKCGKMINQGWFMKYDYFGLYFHGVTVSLDGTKNQGTSHVTTEGSKQMSTGMLDLGLWTNSTTGTSQSTSSWGECSLFAEFIRKERMKIFMAENLNELKMDIASGSGEYLQAASEIYLCRHDKQQAMSEVFRGHFKKIFNNEKKSLLKLESIMKPKMVELDQCMNYQHKS
jgi:hypothetical protein